MDVNLILFKKNGSRKILPLPSDVTVIGRRHDCDLQIPLLSVSKRHCQLNRDRDVLRIRDLGSRNGTHLNGQRVDNAVIKAGDFIKIGPLTFVFQIDGQPQTIPQPDSVAQKTPQKNTSSEDTAVEQFDSFAELDELDSLEQTGST